jgi:hypothetical protein
MHQDERKTMLKKKKEDSLDYKSSDQDMDENTEHEEGEELSPDFLNKFTHLMWECLTHGLSVAAL